ncbi:MAG TPA: hypothetical protein VGC19_07300 [Rhodanobacter sp.]
MDSQTQHYIVGALLVLLGFVLGRIGPRQRQSDPRRPPPSVAHATPPSLSGDFDETRLLAELRAGRFVEAIKLYRHHHGCNLREAKRAVEMLADRHGIRH